MSVSDVSICNDAYDGDLSAVRREINHNNSLVNVKDKNRRTPLHWACSTGHNNIVQFLIHNGAKVQYTYIHV